MNKSNCNTSQGKNQHGQWGEKKKNKKKTGGVGKIDDKWAIKENRGRSEKSDKARLREINRTILA